MPLVDPATAGYNFDVIFGVDYVIDLSRPARFGAADGVPRDLGGPGRIVALCHAGRPVADADRFALATTSYRAAGGGGYRMVPADAPRRAGTETMHEILTGHVAGSREITLSPHPAWSFAPLAATATIDSAPYACLDQHGDPSRRLEPLGATAGGFSRFRLHL